MSHTPGPWCIGIDSDNERTQVIASDGGHICYVEYSPVRANARLIAQAPALLAALIRLVDLHGNGPAHTACDCAFCDARAAIKLAENGGVA